MSNNLWTDVNLLTEVNFLTDVNLLTEVNLLTDVNVLTQTPPLTLGDYHWFGDMGEMLDPNVHMLDSNVRAPDVIDHTTQLEVDEGVSVDDAIILHELMSTVDSFTATGVTCTATKMRLKVAISAISGIFKEKNARRLVVESEMVHLRTKEKRKTEDARVSKALAVKTETEFAAFKAQVGSSEIRARIAYNELCRVKDAEFMAKASNIKTELMAKEATTKKMIEQVRYAGLFGACAKKGAATCPVTQTAFLPNESVLQLVSDCDCNSFVKFSAGFPFMQRLDEGRLVKCPTCRSVVTKIVATTASKAEDLFTWRKLQRLTGAASDEELSERRLLDLDKDAKQSQDIAVMQFRVAVDNKNTVACL
jgi:hypothetical protein